MQEAARIGAWTPSGAPAPLPYDAEVEYLRSDGSQWIDTGIIPTTDDGIAFTFKDLVKINNSFNFIGCRGKSNDSRFMVAYSSGYFGLGFCRLYTTEIPFDLTLIHSVKQNYLNDLIFRVDDFSPVSLARSGIVDLPTFALFAQLNGNSVVFMKYSLYNFAYSRGSDILLDLIPVRFTNETGASEGAMYDKVSGRLFRNSGTGAFTIGPDVVSSRGGSTKCLTPRRSYRRSSRPSARFCAHSQEWEVAA